MGGRPAPISATLRVDEITEANGIQELLANATALGAPALANHFNNPGYNLVQELLVRMRARGMNVWGEIYPYAAGSTALNAVFLEPEMWVEDPGLQVRGDDPGCGHR